MNRYGDRGEIYLLSLDTFMIMAVLGLSLGMIFMVLNPAVGMLPPPPRKDINYILNENEFNNLSNCVNDQEKIDDKYWEIEGMEGIIYNVSNGKQQQNSYKVTVEVYQNQRLIKNEKIMIQMIKNHSCLGQYLVAPPY